jgi:hypothetical protein
VSFYFTGKDCIPPIAPMPMGTLGRLPSETEDNPENDRSSHQHMNGELSINSRRWNSDHPSSGNSPILQKAEFPYTGIESRPVSHGTLSLSRPNTSSGDVLPVTPPTATNARPASTGTDMAPTPAMRHGFAEEYSSEEYLRMLEQVFSVIASLLTGRYFICILHMIGTRARLPR